MKSEHHRHTEFPLECACTHRRERFQLAFARKAIELLPQNDELTYETSARGLVMLAETELALERPLEILREFYGDQVRIGSPSVRYLHGSTVEEPYMGLRLMCPRESFDDVMKDLEERGAEFQDEEVRQQMGVIRATAPLAELLGYPRRLDELTSARARLAMWLSHYAPISRPPPGGTAA